MRLLITASSLEKLEEQLNKYFYSTTYKVIDDKVFFKNPPEENKNITYKTKGKKFQIFQN